jgi:ABC-type transporter Mla subunit MlaD
MRRLIVTLTLAAALLVLAVLGLGASGGGGSGYEVRAIFDNVASAVQGEDVKVAGAKVGVISSMDVTPDKKAAVTLRIDDGSFTPFRRNARCTIRPQSVIGEKFVECQPGTASTPPLERIDSGAGKGQHLLPLSGTSSPVDIDLLNDIMRLPYRQRFAIILNEFGTGLAGRGRELNTVIHRANPALRETDKVLKILARQNRVLARLATDSDTALAPLARERRHVSSFIVQANRTGEATAERRGDIERSIQRLPAFLRQLRPLMVDLASFADQATPVSRDLRAAAPDFNRLIEALGPFSTASIPSIKSLGKATVTGRPALLRARPVIQDLARFGSEAAPTSRNLDELTASLDRSAGIERLMDFIFFQMTAINGFDSVSHYLRAAFMPDCPNFAVTTVGSCAATFNAPSGEESSATAAPSRARFAKAGKPSKGSAAPAGGALQELLGGRDAAANRERQRNIRRIQRQASRPSRVAGGGDPVLDYLLGGGK